MEIFPFAGFLWWFSQCGASVHGNIYATGVVFLLWILELLKAQSFWFTLYKMKSRQLALWRKVRFCHTCQPCHGSTDRWETVVLHSVFWIFAEVVIQHCLVVMWLVPHETVAVLAQVLCMSYSHAPVYSAMPPYFKPHNYVGCVCV